MLLICPVASHFKATASSPCSPLGLFLKRFKLWVAQRQLKWAAECPWELRCIKRKLWVSFFRRFHHPPAMAGQQQSLTLPFCPISLTQGFLRNIQPLPAVAQGLRNTSQELFRDFPLPFLQFCPQTQLSLHLLAPPTCLCLVCFHSAPSTRWQIFSLFHSNSGCYIKSSSVWGVEGHRAWGEGLCCSMLLLNSCFTVCKQDSDSSH